MTRQLPLLSAQGRELLDRLTSEQVSPPRALQLARSLRGRYPPDLIAAALTQQALRESARAKFARAGEMLFTRAGLQQASSERAAWHVATRYPAGAVLGDLCCGIGGNLIALAAGRRVTAVDRDLTSVAFARHNAAVYGAAESVAAISADVRSLALGSARPGRPLAGLDGVFIDPARRADGRRLRAGRSEPPLDFCLGLAGLIPVVGIKAAPGLPHALVPAGWEVEFVAVGRNLIQALLWSPALATAPRRATLLADGPLTHTLVPAPGPPVPLAPPGAFLLDPSPAVTRAGLVEELARELELWKIDPMIAFLSASSPVRTPFARTLRVVHSGPWVEKQFAGRLRALGIGAADIRRRGLAGDVSRIRRRLELRGDAAATVVLTRVNGRPWGLICTPLDDQASEPDPGPAAPGS